MIFHDPQVSRLVVTVEEIEKPYVSPHGTFRFRVHSTLMTEGLTDYPTSGEFPRDDLADLVFERHMERRDFKSVYEMQVAGWTSPIREWVYVETRESAARLAYFLMTRLLRAPDAEPAAQGSLPLSG